MVIYSYICIQMLDTGILAKLSSDSLYGYFFIFSV